MILVDEYAAPPALVGRPRPSLANEPLALTYSRAYRLTRAHCSTQAQADCRTRGRFTRLADALEPGDRRALSERLAEPDPVLTVVDPRPLTRAAGAIQNTYAVSLLQAETLAAAVTHDWPIRFAAPDRVSDAVRRAADQLGLDLAAIADR